MSIIKRALPFALGALIILALAFPVVKFIKWAEFKATYEYTLVEIENGIYGYYHTVSSNVPSGNYEVITLCVNGNLQTYDGYVNIHYTDEEPRLVWHYVRTVHGSTFDVYVPRNSIEVQPGIGLR